MRKVVYIIKSTNTRTTDYNLVKDLPQSAYIIRLDEIKPTETPKQRKDRLERMKRKIDAIILNKACVV